MNYPRRPRHHWTRRMIFKFPALVLWTALLIELLRLYEKYLRP